MNNKDSNELEKLLLEIDRLVEENAHLVEENAHLTYFYKIKVEELERELRDVYELYCDTQLAKSK
jgi:DUF1680 family protein